MLPLAQEPTRLNEGCVDAAIASKVAVELARRGVDLRNRRVRSRRREAVGSRGGYEGARARDDRPRPGQLVQVRERRWVVAEVDAGELPRDPQQPLVDRQHLLTLRSVEDDAEPNESLQVVWELEPGARAFEGAGLPDATALDDPMRFDACLDAVRWGASSSADSRHLLAPFQSGSRSRPTSSTHSPAPSECRA